MTNKGVTKKCRQCGKIFELHNFRATQELYCPFCLSFIENSSDYGFGPVWPAYFFIGNEEFAVITQLNHYKFELDIYESGKTVLETHDKNDLFEVIAIGCPIIKTYLSEKNSID